MLKRTLPIIMLLILMIVLVGCTKTVIDPTGRERKVSYGFVEIDTINGNNESTICYDPTTMICYIQICDFNRLALSPYYIIGKNGIPEIAIYGENYK